ncbi:MAG: hypothetical protein R3Y11_09205 [Pseudomonadota bacterium]
MIPIRQTDGGNCPNGTEDTAVSKSSSTTDADSNAVGLSVFYSGNESEAESIFAFCLLPSMQL